MKKINMLLGGSTGPAPAATGHKQASPQGRLEEFKELKRLGLNVRRG